MNSSRIVGFAVAAGFHLVLLTALVVVGPRLQQPERPVRSSGGSTFTSGPARGPARGGSASSPRATTPVPVEATSSGSPVSWNVRRIQTATAPTSTGTRKWFDHLWQSTLFAALAGLLTFAFRRNRAHVRYWLWFAASAKFLIPFAFLMSLGSQLPWAPAAARAVERTFPTAVPSIAPTTSEGSSSTFLSVSSVPDTTTWQGRAVFGAWACGFSAIIFVRLGMWRRVRAAVVSAAQVDIRGIEAPAGLRVRSAPGVLEPGVVGFIRPVLLVPRGIDSQLTPSQLQAVLAHEFAHVRRRDNLTAFVHMIVEAVFWFHPLVWWIGARLIDERERACDEAVVDAGHAPGVYAESILRVCKLYVQPPLACVSAVTGADLRRRIETIMRNQIVERLGTWRKLLLATAALLSLATPVVIGTLNAPRVSAQSPSSPTAGASSQPSNAALPEFEAAALKLNTSGRPDWNLEPMPGGRLTGTNVPATALIRFAYDLPPFQMSGGPEWLRSDRLDLVAKAEGDPPVAQKRLMLRRLLEQKLGLRAHVETRELPIYSLVMARSDRRPGPKLRRTAADCARSNQPSSDNGFRPPPPDGPPACGYFGFSPETRFPDGVGGHAFRGITMAAFAKTLVPILRRSVIDRTGLEGYYDGDFEFIAELPPPPPPPGVPNPFTGEFLSILTVLPDQLGIKVEAGRGNVDVLIIDAATPPPPE